MIKVKRVSVVPLPQFDTTLEVVVAGNVVTVNGEAFDFGFMPADSHLPPGAVASEHFFPAEITCDASGLITITIVTPVAENMPLPDVLPNEEGKSSFTAHVPASIGAPTLVEN